MPSAGGKAPGATRGAREQIERERRVARRVHTRRAAREARAHCAGHDRVPSRGGAARVVCAVEAAHVLARAHAVRREDVKM